MITPLNLQLFDDFPFPNMSTIVSQRDAMFDVNDHYISVGLSALQNIKRALRAKGLNEPAFILDLPCGHGRVTRVLRAAFPSSKIFVSEIDTDGAEFCAASFKTERLPTSSDFKTLNYNIHFDLIWVGSFITHLPADVTTDFLAFVMRHLSQGGVAVVSSHGQFVRNFIKSDVVSRSKWYGISVDALKQIVQDYDSKGYGYGAYESAQNFQHPQFQNESFGISVISRSYIGHLLGRHGADLLLYEDRAWDNHHDIFAFCRA